MSRGNTSGWPCTFHLSGRMAHADQLDPGVPLVAGPCPGILHVGVLNEYGANTYQSALSCLFAMLCLLEY